LRDFGLFGFRDGRSWTEGTVPFPSPAKRIRSGNGPWPLTGARVATGATFFFRVSLSGTVGLHPFDAASGPAMRPALNAAGGATDPPG
jgi:hypothetical protein